MSVSLSPPQGPPPLLGPPTVGPPCAGGQAWHHPALTLADPSTAARAWGQTGELSGCWACGLDSSPGSAVYNSHPLSLPPFPHLRSGDSSHSSRLTGLATGTCWPLARSCLSESLCRPESLSLSRLFFSPEVEAKTEPKVNTRPPHDLLPTRSAPRRPRRK